MLAGVLLPLALVYHWGEVWPGWVPLLAGRTIPRLLLLVPGFGLGAGIVAYFGMGMVQVTSGSHSEFSDAFLWVAMSAYLVMGVGLVIGVQPTTTCAIAGSAAPAAGDGTMIVADCIDRNRWTN